MIRQFESGASRDTAEGKLAYVRFLSPAVLKRFAEYMEGHSFMPDGTTRVPDNWKKGIPPEVYLDSTWRHFMDLWLHDEGDVILGPQALQDTLCALMFNVMGRLHVELRNTAGAFPPAGPAPKTCPS